MAAHVLVQQDSCIWRWCERWYDGLRLGLIAFLNGITSMIMGYWGKNEGYGAAISTHHSGCAGDGESGCMGENVGFVTMLLAASGTMKPTQIGSEDAPVLAFFLPCYEVSIKLFPGSVMMHNRLSLKFCAISLLNVSPIRVDGCNGSLTRVDSLLLALFMLDGIIVLDSIKSSRQH
jgi:hypothetical protein